MKNYLSTIKLAIGEIQQILPNINYSNKEILFSSVKSSNKLIVSAYINSFPQSSLPDIVEYYLSNYRYSCIRSERHAQTQKYNIRLVSEILPFSLVMQRFPSLFNLSSNLQKLNDALFYAIMQKDGSHLNQERVAQALSKALEEECRQLSTGFLEKALQQFLLLISDGNEKFAKAYGRRRNIRLINQQIFISKCKSIADMYKILESELYKEVLPSNILCLLADSLVREFENVEETNHNITRHPAWCYNNISGNGKCRELNIVCHTTIGCPFFQKAKKLPSGAIQLGGD